MRRICRRNARSAALVTIVGALATGTVISIMGVAAERTVLAQGGRGAGPLCQPGLRPGGPGNGSRGTLDWGAFQVRFCGERGRLTFAMGGAPYVYEFESTLNFLAPPVVAAPSEWHAWSGLYGTLCSTVPSASDLPGAKVTVRLNTYDSKAEASTTVILTPDTEKPTLNTTSTPRKGTKVKPGDTIKVRLEASEEYADNRTGWQTGVKRLQLIDESPNPIVTPHFDNTGGPRPCAAKQWKQFLEVTYTVPPNPPPVIRLRAIAEDFAGNRDQDAAEFPTVDFTGTYEWVRDSVEEDALAGLVKNYSRHAATIALVPQSDGTLKGNAQFSFVMISSQRMPTGCLATDVQGDVMKWDVEFAGEMRRHPDGSLKITMPISGVQPTYRYTVRNECDSFSGESTSPVPPWPWKEATLKDGVFEFNSDPPLGRGEFGAPGRGSGMRMRLEQKPPPARR